MDAEKVTVGGVPLSAFLAQQEKAKKKAEAEKDFDDSVQGHRKNIPKTSVINFPQPKTKGGAIHYLEEGKMEEVQKVLADQILKRQGYKFPETESPDQDRRFRYLLKFLAARIDEKGCMNIQGDIKGEYEEGFLKGIEGSYHGKSPYLKSMLYVDLKKLQKKGFIHTRGEGRQRSYYLGTKDGEDPLPPQKKGPRKPAKVPYPSIKVQGTDGVVQTIYLDLVIRVRVETG